ncbi:MAG: glucose-1-phosphate cytidylyltransferase, partial [Roseburia sp.]|nr:glucose-1-phosphate cytidylyltransferase [Roseburia sp.]
MGFMVMEPGIFDYLGDGKCMLEAAPFEALAAAGEMGAYKHEGFWSPMDTIRDRDYLNSLWSKGEAPWAHGEEDVGRQDTKG